MCMPISRHTGGGKYALLVANTTYMRALLLASLYFCMAAAANGTPPSQQDMQRAILRDRNLSEVEGYLQAGFDLRSTIGCGDFDVLDGAVAIEDPDMVALLIRYGARPKESTFVRAAFLQSFDNAVKIVAAFLRAGSDVNSTIRTEAWQSTALHRAVWRQNVELVHLLISQNGISLNDIDGDGYTALDLARRTGNDSIVELLVRAGADSSPKVASAVR
jgi:ankyrin repeat protein